MINLSKKTKTTDPCVRRSLTQFCWRLKGRRRLVEDDIKPSRTPPKATEWLWTVAIKPQPTIKLYIVCFACLQCSPWRRGVRESRMKFLRIKAQDEHVFGHPFEDQTNFETNFHCSNIVSNLAPTFDFSKFFVVYFNFACSTMWFWTLSCILVTFGAQMWADSILFLKLIG